MDRLVDEKLRMRLSENLSLGCKGVVGDDDS